MTHRILLPTLERGFNVTRSSLKTIAEDKKLVVIPAVGFIVGLALFIVYVFAAFRVQVGENSLALDPRLNIQGSVATFVYYFSFVFLNTGINAVTSHNRINRFNGHGSSIRQSLIAVWNKRRSLIAYAFTTSIVGYLITSVLTRLPIGSRAVTALSGASWGAANFFAVPVIMTNDGRTSPAKAIKMSIQTLKKLWKEGFTTQFALSFVLVVTLVVLYAVYAIAINIANLISPVTADSAALISLIAIVAAVAVIVFFEFLATITRAALYCYAVTGKTPADFDLSVMRSSMTVNKAKSMFS